MRNRYRIYTVENVITEESASRGDFASSEPTPEHETDLRGAIEALEGDSWDTVDERRDSVIAYPADYTQDMSTGDYAAAELIVRGAGKDLRHLMELFYARKRAAEARFQAYLARGRGK